jgi:hypothetical protein
MGRCLHQESTTSTRNPMSVHEDTEHANLENTQIHYCRMKRQSRSYIIRTSLEDALNLLHGNQASKEWSNHVEGYLWKIMWMWGIEETNMVPMRTPAHMLLKQGTADLQQRREHWISTKVCEGKYWIFKNILFVEMKISKLIDYSRGHVSKLSRYYRYWKFI